MCVPSPWDNILELKIRDVFSSQNDGASSKCITTFPNLKGTKILSHYHSLFYNIIVIQLRRPLGNIWPNPKAQISLYRQNTNCMQWWSNFYKISKKKKVRKASTVGSSMANIRFTAAPILILVLLTGTAPHRHPFTPFRSQITALSSLCRTPSSCASQTCAPNVATYRAPTGPKRYLKSYSEGPSCG